MSMREMLGKAGPIPAPRPEDYAPRVLRAVENAIIPSEPSPMPNSSDGVVKSFLEMGENIAKAMEAAGNHCLEQGERRKEEYYRAATVARQKAEYQAREAGNLIDDFIKLKSVTVPQNPQPVLAVTDQLDCPANPQSL